MSGRGSVDRFEGIVLAAILSLREEAYGVTIHARVRELAHPKLVSLGIVYFTLDLLEDNGFISSWLADPGPERGGRARRYYRVEALGERALQESEAAPRITGAIVELWGREWGKPWGRPVD